MANDGIGVKGQRNYSTFSLFGAGSQRADRQSSMLVDTESGNFSVLVTDWKLTGRMQVFIGRAYNHLDDTAGVDRPFGPGSYWLYDMNLAGDLALFSSGKTVLWKAADGSEYEFAWASQGATYEEYTSPAGMHQATLRFHRSQGVFYLFIGHTLYRFERNTGNTVAHLMWIKTDCDSNFDGQGLIIDRVLDGSSKPTEQINYIKLAYYDGSAWTTHNVIQPAYKSGTSLIEKLRLLDTVSGSDYIDLHYTYSTIDGAERLMKMEPKFGSTALNMEVAYDYNPASGQGLQLTNILDSLGYQAGTPYSWVINYTANKVSSIVFPVESGTTGTVAYTYGTSAPASWSHTAPSSWTKVTDAMSHDWYYGHNADGTVMYSVDPLWVNSTHESYTEYAYNADLQITSVKTPKPNAESGQLTTCYRYDANKNLAATVDAYGVVSWTKYGTRASYDTSGTGATVQ